MKILIFILIFLSIKSTDFGKTNVELSKVSGTTVVLNLTTENEGTTQGSDLQILNLKLFCGLNKLYDITCRSNKQLELSSSGTKIQCSITNSITSASMCVLYDVPIITSTGDTFEIIKEPPPEPSKFGDVSISLVSVQGKNIKIKLTPTITGTTSTSDLEVLDLSVQNKALTCKAGKILILEATTGTNLECTSTEEIEANLNCKLSGSAKIISTDDTFGAITVKTNTVTSSFGKLKIGLNSIKGTYVTLLLTPEYEGSVTFNIDGIKLNETKKIDCPKKSINIYKTGTTIECTVSQAIQEEEVCELTQENLQTSMKCDLVIDEEKKIIVARNSKYGKVNISLKSIVGSTITLLIKTTVTGTTESSKFTINDLKLNYDKTEKTMNCIKSSKITFPEEGYDFTCTISSSVNGGKECSLKGVPTFISEGDTFSDIIVSNNTILSSFGDITIAIESIVGNIVSLTLSSVYSGTTKSIINSIDNLKLEEQRNTELKPLTCEIKTNIDFSSKRTIFCELGEIQNGNINFQLKGEDPKINVPDNSRDVFGAIKLKTGSVTSSFGKLEISLRSVQADRVTVSLKSQYSGTVSGVFRISYLYLNNQRITCSSSGVSFELSNEDVPTGNYSGYSQIPESDSYINCEFYDSYYSEETNSPCVLTGTPTVSLKLFTSQVVTSNNQVQSGVRNFGDTSIYLHSIKGTTVYIEIKPSLSGKARPVITNLKLQAGIETLDVKCDVTEKIQLYSNSKKKIKCYIQRTINGNTQCRLLKEGNTVTITSDSGDIFGNAIIDTSDLTIKPEQPKYGDTTITLNKIIGTQINIDISVSSTTIINVANPVVENLYIGDNKLYCVATQAIYFTNNQGQMTCTSSSPITCTDCQLTGTPTIISLGDSDDSFGQTTLVANQVAPTTSTLGDISIHLQEVIGNYVYIGVSSARNGISYQQVDINNLYIDGQLLNCSGNIQFSTTATRIQCSVREPIAYNKNVQITGTPSIKIYSEEESADVVAISETEIIRAKSNTALIFKLISVKENIAIISIDATDISIKTLFENFNIIGLAINDIPIEIHLDEIYLGGGAIQTTVKFNETIERDVPCALNGVNSAQILAEGKTFGPITNNPGTVLSSTFKFGNGTISLCYVQGYSAILNIKTTKYDYTKNTVINDLYINNIPLNCKFNDDIQFVTNDDGTNVECLLNTPLDGDIYCTLKYTGNGDENFEKITINETRNRVYSSFKDFGTLTLGLIAVNGMNVKLFAKASKTNITTTDNFEIKNLYINGKEISCKINDYIEFVTNGNQLECALLSLDTSETFTLTGNEVEVKSLADNFENIIIDEKNSTVRTAPKNVDVLTISLSSVAGNRVTLKLLTSNEIYTYLTIENLKIKNKNNEQTYYLTCPQIYIQLTEKNQYSDNIKCSIPNKLSIDLPFSLINDKNVNIRSYDDFDNIIIETNEVLSTTFGDMIINFASSLIIVEVIPTYPGITSSNLYINNIKLTSLSDMLLDCGTLENIELKETGTKIYCNLKGTIKVDGVNNKLPYFEAGDSDKFGNTLLEKKINNLQNTDCYSIYDKTSCEQNPSCEFTKDTYQFCENRYNNMFNWNNTNNEIDNECILYLNEDNCNNRDKCIWNEENIYSCKKKEIMNCLKLDSISEKRCLLCKQGYELNSEGTKCLEGSVPDDTLYPCSEYNGYYTCNSKSQCSYFYESYNYCSGNSLEETINNKCYLYSEQSSCNNQKGCSWKIHYEAGCREKYIDNCAKLKESDPTSCERCSSGYTLLSGKTCSPETYYCENYLDDSNGCRMISFCEYSNRAYCYGDNSNCYRYLDNNTCNSYNCDWYNGDWDSTCKVKKIDHCLILSKNDNTTCQRCESGYYLANYNRACYKYDEDDTDYYDFHLCYEYGGEKDRCLNNERCEFSGRNYCYNIYGSGECGLYLDKKMCEENEECSWSTESEIMCKIKGIDNCLVLNYEESYQCKQCKDGYQLYNENTECRTSGSQFINISLLILGLFFLLL